jgi:hypothetical protein
VAGEEISFGAIEQLNLSLRNCNRRVGSVIKRLAGKSSSASDPGGRLTVTKNLCW